MTKRTLSRLSVLLLPIAGLTAITKPADAIPAFAQQTGQPCVSCHIGAYGPQLTPIGRAFKIGGYTQGGGEGVAASIPLSLMLITSFNNTASAVPADQVAQHYGANNNFSLDQVSGFIGGGIGQHSGGLMQFTWTDVDNTAHVDNVDLRPYTTVFDVGGKELRIGTTLNNTPTVQDPYNSTFAWGFPYVLSSLAPAPAANVMLAAGLGQSAIGYTVYAWYDNKLYLEGGAYDTLSPWSLARMGNGFGIGSTTSPAPYLRVAYEWQWGNNAAHVGAIVHARRRQSLDRSLRHDQRGRQPTITPTTRSMAVTSFSAMAPIWRPCRRSMCTKIRTCARPPAAAGWPRNTASISSAPMFRIGIQNTYGITLGWQKTWGPANPLLYAPGELTGSNNSKPNSNAFIIEADWVPFGKDTSLWAPFLNLKLGVQYTAYTQFNGGSNNYDGSGRNASDNNTLLAFAWMIF